MALNDKKFPRSKGFTILEMIVVLVIIGLIAGLVGPSIFKQADKSKVETAKTQIKMLRGALHTFRLDVGRLPSQEEGLVALVKKPQDERVSQYWDGPYLDGALPLDPWNRGYVYSDDSSEFEPFSLYSMGADGKLGGEKYDQDLGYLPVK
ncbi:MAG: type II secretion system major pseudopilin GspG [Cellvibrionaceae bacterium]